MKKNIVFVLLLGMAVCASAQAYHGINVVVSEEVTITSSDGILVQSITPNKDKSFTVTFYNTNANYPRERDTYTFDWYLSYKGRRVSDYYTEAVRCKSTKSKDVYCWPGEVPSGYEKYVTVQLGREPEKKGNRR